MRAQLKSAKLGWSRCTMLCAGELMALWDRIGDATAISARAMLTVMTRFAADLVQPPDHDIRAPPAAANGDVKVDEIGWLNEICCAWVVAYKADLPQIECQPDDVGHLAQLHRNYPSVDEDAPATEGGAARHKPPKVVRTPARWSQKVKEAPPPRNLALGHVRLQLDRLATINASSVLSNSFGQVFWRRSSDAPWGLCVNCEVILDTKALAFPGEKALLLCRSAVQWESACIRTRAHGVCVAMVHVYTVKQS